LNVKKIVNDVLHDTLYRLYHSIPYFQNIMQFNGTPRAGLRDYNVVLVNPGFHKQNNFSKNYSKFEYTPSKIFVSPSYAKNLQEYQFEGAPNNEY